MLLLNHLTAILWLNVLLALQAVAIVFVRIQPEWQGRDDNRRIREDGAANSKHTVFHRQNWFKRGGITTAIGCAAWLPALLFPAVGLAWGAFALGVLCYGLFAAGVFVAWFNPGLSERRGLAKWYVSREPRAAYWDRTLVYLATRYHWQPEALHELVAKAFAVTGALCYVVALWTLYVRPLLYWAAAA
jgi:hypothetical protein